MHKIKVKFVIVLFVVSLLMQGCAIPFILGPALTVGSFLTRFIADKTDQKLEELRIKKEMEELELDDSEEDSK